MRFPDRLGIVQYVLLAFCLALIGKSAYEQLYRGKYWAAQGQRQQYVVNDLPAPRGEILDERGDTLVESRLLTAISVAPKEVRSPALIAKLLRQLKVEQRWITAATDTNRKWVAIPNRFLAQDAAPLVALRGIYAVAVMERVYANSAGIRRIVGKVDPRTGDPLDGVELMLDQLLRGDTGSTRIARDHRGRKMDSPMDGTKPEPGNTITLTINRGLQDITERAITDAVDSLGASGGDIVVLNPHTGEVLAMASRRVDPTAVANTAITEPYEPGSTLKPFIAAALLERKRAKPDEMINTYNGRFEIEGRVITDVHKESSMSLANVIKYSSNIGIVRFSERLSHREKYEVLRDLGFGAPTSVPLPAEASGTLREPARWSKQTAASVVMGYEIAVTPLQLATAYASIANGGELLEPHIVKQVRTADGTVLFEAKRRVIRRVMAPEVASRVQQMLREVVEGGTGTRAGLQTIDIAGKSGTARRTVGGKYVAGAYTASFVGLFPSDNPQYVIVAKLDNPSNGYYGGVVAGSVTNVVLRAALAARDASLNLQTLVSSVHDPRPDTSPAGRRTTRAKAVADSIRSAKAPPPEAAPVETDPRTNSSYVVKLPAVSRIAPVTATVRPIPQIAGMSMRNAVQALHSAGFRVSLIGGGGPLETIPAAGTLWMPGRVVKLSGGE